MYLMWYDNDRRKAAPRKIAEATERYVEKFGHPPTVVLVNPAEAVSGVKLRVIPRPTIRPGHYWLGEEIPPEPISSSAA